jgi:long-chain-fatty-acyl-CoA reductase
MQKVPLIISGKEKIGKNRIVKFASEEGEIKIALPSISENDIRQMKNVNKNEIHDLCIDEIISFLEKVGKLWASKTYDKREELVDITTKITGYSKPMIELGMQQIRGLLSKEFLEATLINELGDKRLLDDWLPRNEASVHCQPRGNILHILAGNIPVVCVMSLVRGVLTKNCNILKMSSRDVVTASYIAQSFADIELDHPITKTTSAIYWPANKENVLNSLLSFVNCVCTWGGKEAVESIRKKAPSEVELLEFGPRRGIQLIGREAFENLKQVTIRAAHDLTLFDQEACFQRVLLRKTSGYQKDLLLLTHMQLFPTQDCILNSEGTKFSIRKKQNGQ